MVHDADDEYGNPTQWSATLSEGVFLWIDKEADGYAIYDTADITRPALETFSTLQEAMDWGNELAESGMEAEAEFSGEREQAEQEADELDSIDTQSARERLENGEADRQTEEMLSQVLTGDWEPLTPSSEEKQPASERQSAQERSVSAPDKSNAVNFHISDDRLGEGSPKENSRQILQQSSCWSRLRAKTDMLHRKNSRFYPSMSAGAVLPMRLTRANQTGQQNITS